MFAQQRLAHRQRVERRDKSPDRHAVDRWRGDQREFAHAGHGELQRTRNRRGGQREHVNVALDLLEPLLVLDAEMLLLVDDQQTEIGEIDRRTQKRMRANDDVALAGFQFLLGQCQFLRAHKTRGL